MCAVCGASIAIFNLRAANTFIASACFRLQKLRSVNMRTMQFANINSWSKWQWAAHIYEFMLNVLIVQTHSYTIYQSHKQKNRSRCIDRFVLPSMCRRTKKMMCKDLVVPYQRMPSKLSLSTSHCNLFQGVTTVRLMNARILYLGIIHLKSYNKSGSCSLCGGWVLPGRAMLPLFFVCKLRVQAQTSEG